MTSPIITIGQAVRHGMFVRVECSRCGRVREYSCSELMMKVAAGRDPLSLKFRCTSCAPPVKVTLRERPRKPEQQGKTIGEAIGSGERIYVNCHDVQCQSSALLSTFAHWRRSLGRSWGYARRPRAPASLLEVPARRPGGFACIPGYDEANASG